MSTRNEDPGWHMRPNQPYVEELHQENQNLRGQVSFLEEEVESLRMEKVELEKRLEGGGHQARCEGRFEKLLLRQLDDTIDKNRHLMDRCAQIEHKCNDFAHLLAASYRLQAASRRREVVEGLRSILVNLVGCEELAIFEWCEAGGRLRLVESLGLTHTPEFWDLDPVAALAIEDRRTVRREELRKGTLAAVLPTAPVVCVPLLAGDEVLGLVSLFQLLPQKSEGLGALDLELLDLLSRQGGRALQWTASEGDTLVGSPHGSMLEAEISAKADAA